MVKRCKMNSVKERPKNVKDRLRETLTGQVLAKDANPMTNYARESRLNVLWIEEPKS